MIQINKETLFKETENVQKGNDIMDCYNDLLAAFYELWAKDYKKYYRRALEFAQIDPGKSDRAYKEVEVLEYQFCNNELFRYVNVESKELFSTLRNSVVRELSSGR